MMSSLQVSISELLLSLDSPELQEAEQVRAAVNQQLNTDRGGAVLGSLVDHYLDHYLDSSSCQAVLLLSSVREPHHKPLLEKLNEALNRPGSRLAGLTLLGHLIRNQPPWVHHISRSALLLSLLRCLKTDTDVVALVTGVLVLVTLLPMMPQAGRLHIYHFCDVFGRLVSWSHKNPGHVTVVHMVHLQAGAYSLFHRLYGMFPCSFLSYLRLHYSMKENLDAFQEVVKPMLEHVRVHPELVTGTQDYELDPSRWRCYEVHDIVIECSRVSLDPLESSCEDDMFSSIRDTPPSIRDTPPSIRDTPPSIRDTPPSIRDTPASIRDTPPSIRDTPPSQPHLQPTCSPLNTESVSSSGSSVCAQLLSERLTMNSSFIQADDVTWSPSSQCGLSTPPPEPAATGSAPPLSRTASISGVRCPSSATVPANPLTEEKQDGGHNKDQVKPVTHLEGSSTQPITELQGRGPSDVINNVGEDVRPQQPSSSSSSSTSSSSSQPALLTSTPRREEACPPCSISLCLTPPRPSCTTQTSEEGGSALSAQSSALSAQSSALSAQSPALSAQSPALSAQSPALSAQSPALSAQSPALSAQSPALSAQSPALSAQSPALSAQSPAPPYELLFELALPRAATLFIGRMTQEVLQRAEKGGGGGGGGEEKEQTYISPLEVLDQLIVHGHDAHEHLSRRLSAGNKSVDWSHFGGKQQSMKTKGPAQGEELQSLRSQLLLVHSQLQYERFKRQQHAVRNRRLLRRVINGTALEEHAVAMKGQLSVQDEEIRSLKSSLQEEQRRCTHLQHDTHTHTTQLHTHNQQLLLQQQDEQRGKQRLESELQECQSRLRDLEAELQKANNKAYNAEHQLTQLSLKLCSSEQLQQQIFLLNQQLVLLRETNRALSEQLDGGEKHQHTEASMLQCSVGKEFQRLKDSDVQQRQKLEAANHRTAELENQLANKDQLVLDQKKLLEDSKAQSRGELAACESRCEALRRVTQTLQTETLHLYSQIHLDQDLRPNGGSFALPAPQGSHKPRPFSSSSVGIINGAAQTFSSSPLHLLSCSSSPLAAGSFLEQRARQMFRPTNHSQEEEQQQQEEEEEEEEEEQEEEQEEEEQEEDHEFQPGSPPLGQEAELLLAGSPQTEPPSRASAYSRTSSGSTAPPAAPPADLTLAVRQRRNELSIMDYDETLPEC